MPTYLKISKGRNYGKYNTIYERMKKSLFRFADALELCVGYVFCFTLNMLFNYVKTLEIRSYLLKMYFQNFIEYEKPIIFLFTFIVFVFHYQMLCRKRIEVFCKILVGDNIFSCTIRYISDCLILLGGVSFLSVGVCAYLHLGITSNLYLILIFIIYILISSSWVKKYENL